MIKRRIIIIINMDTLNKPKRKTKCKNCNEVKEEDDKRRKCNGCSKLCCF